MTINPQDFIIDIPDLHPASKDYVTFWREQKRNSIEGKWLGGYYMPSSLYFYSNLGIIQLNKGESNIKTFARPWLRDLEWKVFRYYTACRGFSGFELDDEYSSHYILLDPLVDDDYLKSNYPSTISSTGERKQFVHPISALEEQHPYHKGKALFNNNAWNGLILGSRDTGKGLPLYTLIPTPSGYIEIKDLIIGSKVFGIDGIPCEVTGIYPQGLKKTYELTLSDGRVLVTDEDHLNLVYDGKAEKVLSSKEIFSSTWRYKHKKSGYSYRYKFPTIEPVQYQEVPVKIPPYALGALLGDGDMTHPTPRLSTDDTFILDKILAGMPFLKATRDFSTNNFALSVKDRSRIYWDNITKRANPLSREIKRLNLNVKCEAKFIPHEYLYNSIPNRMELLQGLLDTDGSISKSGNIEFVNKNKLLCEQVVELCRGLGIQAKLGVSDRIGQTRKIKGKKDSIITALYYRVYINTHKEVFSLPRKRDKLKSKMAPKPSLISIKELGEEATVCISVDNISKTYLATKDYIPTHNSYSVGIGMALKEWLFDGATEYTQETIDNPAAVDITVGAEDSQKSTLMMTKMRMALERLPGEKIVGGRLYPSPISKQYQGSWMVGKHLIAEYEKKYPGGWRREGSQSMIKHRSFKDNPFADQGARNILIVLEEIGMFSLLKQVFFNTRDNLQDGTRKIGSLMMLGTGGDMDGGTLDAQEMFYNPEAYDIFHFEDLWERRGRIGFFIPAYMSINSYKDNKGNTKVEDAKNYWLKKREAARTSSKGSEVLNKLIQYRPLVPSEMFLSRSSSIFPSVELQKRLGEIRDHKIYDLLEKRVNLYFDPKSVYNGVNYEIDTTLNAIHTFPWKEDADQEGSVVLYELPALVGDIVPNGAYVIGCDAFKANTDGGSSYAAIYVMKTNKYPSVVGYDEVVASYVGRPYLGMSQVNEILYKLSLFYGNAKIYFENTAGNVKDYFDKIKRLDLLANQPTSVLNRKASYNTGPSVVYGYPMSNDKIKWEALQYVRTWLLQERETDATGKVKRNLDLLVDTYLIQQLIAFNMDGNFDAVMGFVGCVLGLEEMHHKSRSTEQELQYSELDNQFIKLFRDNKRLFH